VLRFPGVEWATKPTIEFGGRGELAIAFWGSSESQGSGDGWLRKDGRPYDGYLSVCRDFDAAEPTFSTLRARAGDGALIPDGESVFSSGEYLGQPAFGPDGSVWAGFLGKHVGGIVARLLPDCSRN
jgi:hypothetical protein